MTVLGFFAGSSYSINCGGLSGKGLLSSRMPKTVRRKFPGGRSIKSPPVIPFSVGRSVRGFRPGRQESVRKRCGPATGRIWHRDPNAPWIFPHNGSASFCSQHGARTSNWADLAPGSKCSMDFFPIMDPRPFVANMERVDSSA